MYQAPEIEHLDNAVKAIRRGLIPEMEHSPSKGEIEEIEAEDNAREESDE